jgi:hypothetical protein
MKTREMAVKESPLQVAEREAAAQRDALAVALVSAHGALADAKKTHDVALNAWGEALATQELSGGPEPSRKPLESAKTLLQDAELRVRALERRRPEVERIWRAARVAVLDAEEQALRVQIAADQEAIDALKPERLAIDTREAELFGRMRARMEQLAPLARERDDLRRQGA